MKKGEKYEKPYLNDVIFRVDFSNLLRLSGNNKEAAEDFRKVIFEQFPNVNFKFNNEISMDFDLSSGDPKQFTKDGNIIWIFSSEDSKRTAELSATFLTLHYKKGAYTHFRNFLRDVILIIEALRIYSPINLKYLGLRYINQITNKNLDELKLSINPTLFNNNIFDLDDNEEFIQIFTKFNIKKEDYILTIQYGVFNAGFPRPDFNKDYILDYDCRLNNIKSLEDIPNELKKMNKFIAQKYEESITDYLRENMGGVKYE